MGKFYFCNNDNDDVSSQWKLPKTVYTANSINVVSKLNCFHLLIVMFFEFHKPMDWGDNKI